MPGIYFFNCLGFIVTLIWCYISMQFRLKFQRCSHWFAQGGPTHSDLCHKSKTSQTGTL